MGRQLSILRWVSLAAILCCLACLRPAFSAEIDKSYTITVLTVTPQGAGACREVSFSLTRKPFSKAPLSIAIAEDTPGGTGQSLRASVWLAAMVAALQQSDDLSGTRISLQFSGQVDGGSAGGVICLAILSALDGRPMPRDCLMTGSIMPDGTIGSVGGIAQKMRAAAAAGAKRILVPTCLRFEKDPKSGEEVDLKALAASLKLEFTPVEHITDAYALAHRLTLPPPQRPDLSVLELPAKTEALLKSRYNDAFAAGSTLWAGVSDDEKKQIAANPILKLMLIDIPAKAQSAYRSGRLLVAADEMQAWHMLLQASHKSAQFLAGLKAEDLATDLQKVDEHMQNLTRAGAGMSQSLLAAQKSIPESGLQLTASNWEGTGFVGMIALFEDRWRASLQQLRDPQLSEEQRRQIAQSAWELRMIQLLAAQFMADLVKTTPEDVRTLAQTLPPRKISGDSQSIERLFYSAFLAAQNSFDEDVVAASARAASTTPPQMLQVMMTHDPSLVAYPPVVQALGELHRQVLAPRDPQEQRITAAMAAHAHANGLGLASELIVRWSELDVDINDQGELRYSRRDLLNYLLSRARENALAAIAQCRRQGILCIEPIACFEAAELGRDDPDEDKVNVLGSYWKASLRAKALLMMFRPPG